MVPVVGDIQESQLGMRKEDQQMLQERVSIVFHLAATVRFESPLRLILYLRFFHFLTLLTPWVSE